MEFSQPITRFALAPLKVPYHQWNGKCELICDGQLTDKFVPGCELKAQYQTGNYFVLVTEYNCVFEESVSITLLADNLRPIASSTVPQMLFPAIGGPSYFFEKLVWYDAHHFDLYIKDEPLIYRYEIRDFAIPVFWPRLAKRLAPPPL